MNELDYDGVDWSKFFYYDESSPSCLKWSITSYSGNNYAKLEIYPGKDAGSLKDAKNGDNKPYAVYVRTSEEKYNCYAVHRIIACLHGLKVNGSVIDHINGCSSDNRIENLRVASLTINARNCRPQHNSPYGMSGVGFQEDGNGNAYFIARWYKDGKRLQESFPIKRIGVMEAFRQAVVRRQKRILELNNKQDAYTERHTKIDASVKDMELYRVSREEYAKSFRTKKKRSNNTSGVVGVSWGKLVAIAHWRASNGSQLKSFSVRKLGLLPAFAAACAYRDLKIKELNELGYGYSDNHGK